MKKYSLSIAALVIGIIIGSVGLASAHWEDREDHENYSEERHEEMQDVFENKDYEGWKELHQGRGRVSEIITEENFDDFAKAHELMEEGKNEEADAIRAELGLGSHGGGRGRGRGGNGCGCGMHGVADEE